ncbi:MAG: flagellar hook capping FlgD N-terminal domain-containing protein [Desulfotomaculaceae bacterium]
MDFSIATLANVINPKKEKSKVPGTLDKDAFLQILTTQLRYQDPTSPMDTDSFITQMSQFTMMEQMMNMASVIEGMAQTSVFRDATSVIGKEVKLVDAQRGEYVNGIVEKVNLGNGIIEVEVNGQMYNFMSIYEVKNPAEAESPVEPEDLAGVAGPAKLEDLAEAAGPVEPQGPDEVESSAELEGLTEVASPDVAENPDMPENSPETGSFQEELT